MKIVVDINHPAHVHYFKNFIWEMQKRGHEILITASEKEFSYTLLNNYGFSYIKIGNYGKSILEKLVKIPILDIKMLQAVRKFQPDLFIGHGSIRAAHVSKLMGKPCIALEDTEHATWEHFLYVPFTDVILTPSCFKKNFGEKHIRFEGYLELQYLHPNYFVPNPNVLLNLGLTPDQKFFILRFVSWDAIHDYGQYGIHNKIGLVKALEPYGRVFITSESELSPELEPYRVRISPEKMHDLLSYATLYIGEGATMATEAGILGTPSIFVSSLANTMGNSAELEEKYNLVYSYADIDAASNKAIEILQDPGSKEKWKSKCKRLIKDKIDVTSFVIQYIENFNRN